MKIPQDFIEKIKRDVSIVDVAEDYFKLHQTGSVFQASCIHEGGDKSPSLTFFTDTNSFHCFGCGAGSKQKTDGSDIISFVMWVDNCSFPEAVQKIAAHAGLKVPAVDLSPDDKKKAQILSGLLDMNRVYWAALQENQVALKYLNERGITSEEINKFRIGWVPFDDPQKIAGRLSFAIMNDWGQTVGFSFRNMEEYLPNPIAPDTGPKYVNSPKSLVFDKGSLLYGLNFVKRMIREKDYVVVAEGFGDTIMGQKYNCPFVSIMGTSLTAEHIKMLSRYTKNIYVWLDGDSAGVAAALRHLAPLRAEGLVVKIIYTPGKDPDDVCIELGDKLEEFILAEAVLAGQFEIDLVMTKFRSDVAEIEFKTINQVRKILQAIPSDVERTVYAKHSARQLNIPPELLLRGSALE